MTLRFRVCFTSVMLAAIIGLVLLSEDADACGGRFRLFSGPLFGKRCVPIAPDPCLSDKTAIAPVEPVKKPPPVMKDLRVNVKNIADLLKKGDNAGAKKLAADTANDPKLIEEIVDLMHLYRPIDKGGLGLESRIRKPVLNDAEEVGYLVNAMAELILAKGWPERNIKQAKKRWIDHTEELRVASVGFAKAKNVRDLAFAAEKVNNACTRCHMVFKY